MMEVGRMKSFAEDRSHFGAWVITSSPLVLGYDLTDTSVTDRVWSIISNTEAIGINQAWAGHPGRRIAAWTPNGTSPYRYAVAVGCDGDDGTQEGWRYDRASQASNHVAITHVIAY